MSFHRNFGSGVPVRLRGQYGQTIIFVVLLLGIFLLGFIGLAVDYTNMWFHRQAAQGAADAACQAGAMDMMTIYNGTTLPNAGFTPGNEFDCATASTAAPCRYAALNGYSGTGLVASQESNQVHVSFPSSVPGVISGNIPPASLASSAFMRVDVVDRAKVFFAGLLTGNRTQDVRAFAECGLELAKVPIPLIVLNPTCQNSLQIAGAATLKIVGGPNRSVQVNSDNTTCAAATTSATGCSGNGSVDLSQGGPAFSGSNFGAFGVPHSAPPGFIPGSTGSWTQGSVIGDPYARVTPPAAPAQAPQPILVNWTGATSNPDVRYGCPDHGGCIVYFPGYYNRPIVVSGETALFVPGIYYIQPSDFSQDYATYRGTSHGCTGGSCSAQGGTVCGTPACSDETKATGQACKADFLVQSNGVVRPARDDAPRDPIALTPNDGSHGTFFYLSGSSANGWGSASFMGNAGNPGGRVLDPYQTTNVTCPPGGTLSTALAIPSTIGGNILNGQCTTGGNYYPNDSIGANRGLLFFQDHANNAPGGQMNFQGSGGMLLSGTVYAHNCTGSSYPAATSCGDYSFPTGDYQAFVQLQGTPGSGTYVLGEIVTDQLQESGNGTVAMQLNTNAVLEILKVQLMR